MYFYIYLNAFFKKVVELLFSYIFKVQDRIKHTSNLSTRSLRIIQKVNKISIRTSFTSFSNIISD